MARKKRQDFEEKAKEGIGAIERWYMHAVADLAHNILDDAKDREIEPDDDEFSDVVHEGVDNSQLIIYTHYNFWVLMASRNHDAYVEEFGTEGVATRDSINWAGLAFAALERDVYDELKRIEEGHGLED